MYKKLSDDDVRTTPYTARKKWSLNDKSDYLTFHIGIKESPFDPSSGRKNPNTGIYMRSVYEMIKHRYYDKNNLSEYFGVKDPSKVDLSNFPEQEEDERNALVYVLKISSQIFGKRIVPGTFKVQSKIEENPITAVDDENGNLISEKTGTQIGNVFYTDGVVVLTNPPEQVFEVKEEDVDYLFDEDQNLFTAYPDYEKNSFDLLFQRFDLEFESLVRNFEHEISATINSDEFGTTTNPTARKAQGEPIEPLADGNFRPYVTSIGYYNDDGELIATGKLAQPIKLPENTPMTILGRFDT